MHVVATIKHKTYCMQYVLCFIVVVIGVLAVVILHKCEVAQNFNKIGPCTSSRSPKVIDFGSNGKRTYDCLSVINSNHGPILHRFRDTATYWLKIAYFFYPSLILRPRSLCSPSNFAARFGMGKLESWGYPVV